MRPHHERAIRKLADHFSRQEGYLAVIVGGSVAKGVETEYADIDVMLVVTDELYERHRQANNLIYFSMDFCDYPGGYVDGKIITLEYLRAAAERGNEATRAAFTGAFVACSSVPEVDELVRSIPVYQKHEQQEKIRSFLAQFEAAHWYLGEALKRDDRYLLVHAASDLVLYGGRLILAHNEILYPYHKLFMTELEKAPERPANLMELIRVLLEEPNAENARAFYDAIKGFRQWDESSEFWAIRFMKDTELAWLENTAYVGDI
jgi:predicted nucleotidyltransferase